MHTKLVRTPALYLVGFMGSGKSTVGAALADELGWHFTDLDEHIETEAGVTISDMFNELGEPEFRRIEHQMLQKLVRGVQFGKPTVMAVGGGAFVQQTNFDMLEDNGVSIWLDCELDLIRQRISGQTHRPLAQDPVKFEALFQSRREGYARADFRIEVGDNNMSAIIQRIMALPLFD